MEFGPESFLSPLYLADPRRPTFGFSALETSDSEIMGAGESRYGVRIGQRFSIARFYTAGDCEGGFQLDGELGFNGQFDADNSSDNIGWDGLYGLELSWSRRKDLTLHLGFFHDSSHLGDEFIEDTGRIRIDYTREEYFAGASWAFAEGWLTYGEYGHAFSLSNQELMEPGRLQVGLQHKHAPNMWSSRIGWYVATDFSFYEEDSWSRNLTAQAGLTFGDGLPGSLLRFGLEYYDGRSQIGEFFQSQESHLALGFWLDL
ncbi:MAG: hypothetical protein ACI8X5_001927 [Planctomycetota bacterium]|jgi:hypothetical protein